MTSIDTLRHLYKAVETFTSCDPSSPSFAAAEVDFEDAMLRARRLLDGSPESLLIYRSDWYLQDYIDSADFTRERGGQRVSPLHRVAFVNGVRVWDAANYRPGKWDKVVVGDSFGMSTFTIGESS